MPLNPEYATPEKPIHIGVMKNGRQVKLAGTDTRRGFTFTIKRGEIFVQPGDAPANPGADDSTDWRKAMTPYEKVNVMHALLSRYRKRSSDPDGVHVASIGVTSTGHLYIAVNGSITSKRSHRQCSEQKVVSNGEEQEADYALERGREPGKFRLEEIYIEGGREPDMHSMGPCGDCTDLLTKAMKKDGKVFILPSGFGDKLIDINDRVEHIGQLPPSQAWATTIGYLNRNREIEADDCQRELMDAGMAKARSTVRDCLGPIEENPNAAITVDAQQIERHGHYAARVVAGKEVPLEKLNNYMREQIMCTLADRLDSRARHLKLGSLKDLSDDQVNTLIESDIKWVRCAVVQRDDGKLFASVTAKVKGEKTSEIAETNAFGQAMRRAGTYRCQKVWCMEFNPEKSANGIFRTSAKSAVERLMKWASLKTGTVDFYYMPFNAGGLKAADVSRAMVHKSATALYPSGHFGVPGALARFEQYAQHDFIINHSLAITPPPNAAKQVGNFTLVINPGRGDKPDKGR